MARISALNSYSLNEAAAILRDGGLVGMPTETVYGLAADATNGEAVAKIFEAKGRPSFNPLIVHVGSVELAEQIANFSKHDHILAQKFWPGPLTLILERRAESGLSDLVSAGLPTVAMRVPAHKGAQELLGACGVPLAAPSANVSGSLSPTTPVHVEQGLGDKVDMILADGACDVGLESTVVDCTGENPVILRPGGITAEDLSNALGIEVSVYEGDDVKSPGQLLKHYSPSIPVRLDAMDLEDGEALLAFGSTKFMGVKSGGAAADLPKDMVRNLSEEGSLYEAASNLFAMMRALDNPAYKAIAVMNIPDVGIGAAINDRLKRAAQG